MPEKNVAPLSSVDTAWLRMDAARNHMIITGLLMFDTTLPYDRLREVTEHRLLAHERFRQRVHLGERGTPARWEDDPHFDLAAHMHSFPAPGSGDDEALRKLVSELMGTPLDMSRPPWQMYLIQGVNGGDMLVFRLHHCLGDGVALANALLSLTDNPPGSAEPAPERQPGPSLLRQLSSAIDQAVATTQSAIEAARGTLAHPERAFDLVSRGMSGAATLSKLLFAPPEQHPQLKPRLGVAKCAAWSHGIPLATIKALGKPARSTVNDVLLTALTGALRRWLIDHGGGEAEDVRVMVPVNLRRPDDTGMGNRFGLVYLELPTSIADPIERMLELQTRMDEIKHSPEAPLVMGILNVMGAVPGPLEQLAVEYFTWKAAAVVTNVRGPDEPIAIAGQPVRGVIFWVPESGSLGLGLSILSYAGEVRIGVATDAHLGDAAQRFVEYFEQEVEALRAALHV